MRDEDKTKEQLIDELAKLRKRVTELGTSATDSESGKMEQSAMQL